ncbi:MAG: hypothetical protein COZ06_18185 [Armatimonadetes bacterium CG_4_10_14_3_um_filter_66_18]|nr:hypothetical protein [Armatimonadota bacterium]OIO96592.1 MAG: hypothetical protein AUJ96_24535 [Armatimonadetes bacterium CG2_30_66_41]PIU67336.1 MAG: hypothetical protein COS85_01105 [Armatimonadetes bacterium CG07_land_8_20_14_0_80_59_28]PIU94509.1 MAG: hypothetical protein COS65_07260 [Armatimonadetes bacterium CG06_land_8_20_14_3_00_66_21]PIX43427.1 MAG: hypothetical protein COZ57_19245 [Armatimonadetes bacterium CG_4_8_14_3_um_filter_66_20]PIY46939.1 MAG: hypothetical protein COZ06_18
MLCPKCGYSLDSFEKDCPRCANAPPPEPKKPDPILSGPVRVQAPPPELDPPRRHRLGASSALCVCLGVAGFLLLFCCKYHVVQSSENGTDFVPKVNFTLSETFVSMDAITGMPFVQARSRWPLAVKALQAEGMLESDEDFEARIQAELDAKMAESKREAQAEFDRIMGGGR